jgi:hypothetical protein
MTIISTRISTLTLKPIDNLIVRIVRSYILDDWAVWTVFWNQWGRLPVMMQKRLVCWVLAVCRAPRVFTPFFGVKMVMVSSGLDSGHHTLTLSNRISCPFYLPKHSVSHIFKKILFALFQFDFSSLGVSICSRFQIGN